MKQVIIRKGQLDDLSELQQLFVDTITTVCKEDYNSKQIHVWTSGVGDKKRWQDIMAQQFVLIARDNEKIIGFCTLDNGNYIDLLYVHKDYQRQGIANRLYAQIEKESRRQGENLLTANVSKTAKPFFESVGFDVTKEQTVVRQGVELTNFKMTKKLT